MKSKIILCLLAAMFSLGCAIVEGPKEKLSKSAFMFNEGLRWGRYDDVLPVVDQKHLEHFMDVHKEWGRDVQISSAEIASSTYNEEDRTARIQVTFVWYRKKEMVVRTTVTLQNWEYREGHWIMVAEEFKSGDPF